MSRAITDKIIELIRIGASEREFRFYISKTKYMKQVNTLDLLDILYHAAVYAEYSVYEIINHGYINQLLDFAFEDQYENSMQDVVRDLCHNFWPDEY